MKLYVLLSFDDEGRETGREYFDTIEKAKLRAQERRYNLETFEEEIIFLPQDIWKLNVRFDIEGMSRRDAEIRALKRSLKTITETVARENIYAADF